MEPVSVIRAVLTIRKTHRERYESVEDWSVRLMWCSRGCLGPHATSVACLWHVSVVGGARRRGCAAGGVSVIFNWLLGVRNAVAPDVAAGAAHADVGRLRGVRRVAQRPHRGGVDAREAARAEGPGVPAERDLDRTVEDDVDLFLGLVVMRVRRVGGREDDGVDAEGGHAQLPADLAEARTGPEP